VTRTEPAEVTVRRAGPEDADAIADLYTAAREHAVPQMPPAMHTNAEDRAYVAARLVEDDVTMWVAEAHTDDLPDLLGFASCTPTWLNGLYVRPDLKGQGIGSLLLDVVEATHPDGYELWVFESNIGARRLYERRGLVEVERTDGSGNEEKSPDIRMAWRP
jgi:GNAT superfamily N-acetyltransferase